MLAEHLEDVGQERDPAAEEGQPHVVELLDALDAIVGQVPVDQEQAGQAERDIEKEDQPPVEVPDDQPAGQRTQHRSDERGDRHEGHRADQLRSREGPDHGEPAHGHHHRASHALQDSKRDQQARSVEIPQRIDPSVKIPIADENTRRVPNRSATQPLTGMKTARLRV